MARWDISKSKTVVKVMYTNSITGARHNCGDQHPDTSIRLIMEWTADQAAPGDVVLVDGQFVAQKFPPAEA
jgi:hypothetical protein